MNNKRVVLTREPDTNKPLKTATIKEFTGGDEINQRTVFSGETKTETFMTFLFECNKKPNRDNSSDNSMARRLINIHFKSEFIDQHIYDK